MKRAKVNTHLSTVCLEANKIIRAVKALIFKALMHCVNFYNALINALLMHPGPSRGRVRG